jgi:hypothetical protein
VDAAWAGEILVFGVAAAIVFLVGRFAPAEGRDHPHPVDPGAHISGGRYDADDGESAWEDRISRARRVAFFAWAGVVTATLGIMFFGLTSLVLGWFEAEDGPIIPVTDLGHGVLVGILITGGVLVQLRASERRIAGVQQATLGSLALLISCPLASDTQNVAPGLITLAAIAVLAALHPARREFFRRGISFSPALAAIAVLGAVPFITYALSMAAQARVLVAPPHHIQRLATMAAMAIAVILVGLLAAFQTRGWRIPAWCAGAAAMVFGLASVVFPTYRGSAGRGLGALALGGGFLFIVVAEGQASRQRRERPET